MRKSVFYILGLCAYFLVLQHANAQDPAVSTNYDLDPTIDNTAPDLVLVDCRTAVLAIVLNEDALRQNCHIRSRVREGATELYAYPKIDWRSFGVRDILNANNAVVGNEAFGDQGGIQVNQNSKIIYSGDSSAVDLFQNVANNNANIGGIAVNNDNREQIQIHTRYINRIGNPPLVLALYNQYNGLLYMHAFKARRTTFSGVEVLHARLSPLHLGFLQGEAVEDGHFRRFYNNAAPYVFNGIDFPGVFTAAGQLAKYLGADTVIAYVPRINIEFEDIYTGNDNIEDVLVIYEIEPKWFYGIPQEIGDDVININAGFSNAICASDDDENVCPEDNIIQSNLLVLEASEFFQVSPQPFDVVSLDAAGVETTVAAIPAGNIGNLAFKEEVEKINQQLTRTDIINHALNFPASDVVSSNFENDDVIDLQSMLSSLGDNIINIDIEEETRGFQNNNIQMNIDTTDNGEFDNAKAILWAEQIDDYVIQEINNEIDFENISDGAFRSIVQLLEGGCDIKEVNCGLDFSGAIPRAGDFANHSGSDLVAPLLRSAP